MITIAPRLTEAGMSLLIRGVAGEEITFTRFKIGNGTPGTVWEKMRDLANPLLEVGIGSIDAHAEGYVELSGQFDSSDITNDFRWAEMGVFARGPEGEEVLYAYSHDAEGAGMLLANPEVAIEQSMSFIVAIGTAEKVTALVVPSALYAAKSDFDAHTQAQNPHKITPVMIGLGNVQNVGVNDMEPTYSVPEGETQPLESGEPIRTAFGKIARAILNLIAHLNDRMNPHKVTAEQAGAAKKEHTHGAGDIDKGILGVERGGTGVDTAEKLKAFLGSGVVTGVYFGDGKIKRHIELGFTPSAVLLVNGRGMVGDDIDGVCGGLCIGEYGLRSRGSSSQSHETLWNNEHTAMMINDSGFFVSYNSSTFRGPATNKSGETYRYIAWR